MGSSNTIFAHIDSPYDVEGICRYGNSSTVLIGKIAEVTSVRKRHPPKSIVNGLVSFVENCALVKYAPLVGLVSLALPERA